MKISLVVPVFNEEDAILFSIKRSENTVHLNLMTLRLSSLMMGVTMRLNQSSAH